MNPLVIGDEARALVWSSQRDVERLFGRYDAIEAVNTARVLEAFQAEKVSARHFAPTTGYGYDDIGRDTLDRVFAAAIQAEKALVRPQLVNGTHAIFTMLAGLCTPGDRILSVTGRPYDTLEQGLCGDAPNSLKNNGVAFEAISLHENGEVNMGAVSCRLKNSQAKLVFIQRSRGYAWRNALTVAQIQEVVSAVKRVNPDVIVAVDNCYGEFTEATEPTAVGADVISGSMIKNPGGGLAPTGGYVAGREDLVERIAQRLTVPGMGGEVGSYAGSYRPFYQGLFMAPHSANQSLKSAVLFARLFERSGYATMPASDYECRSDVIQAIRFDRPEELVSFCQCIQMAAPIDSFAVPEPWDMPGYEDKVIMAAGTFVQGATSELSADGPVRPPYIAYLQGALTYAHGRLAAMIAAERILSKRGAK